MSVSSLETFYPIIRWFRTLFPAVGLALQAGCVGPENHGSGADLENWRPHLLYTSAEPYRKLEVEIDVVEGATVDEEGLKALERFLIAYCDKPDGIHMVRSDTISAGEAAGRPARSLALEYINGPSDAETAFLYFLYYDGRKLLDGRNEPHTLFHPYHAAIFINQAHARMPFRLSERFERSAVVHEAGHALGLCWSLKPRREYHCLDRTCLMYEKIYLDPSRLLLLRDPLPEKQLCLNCDEDLKRARSPAQPSDLRWAGPYMVRAAPGYQVLSLPCFLYVHIGAPEEIDWTAVERARMETVSEIRDLKRSRLATNRIGARDIAPVLPQLKKDPHFGIRDLAEKLERQFFK